ncbi:MAG TPA: FAD-binding oxidoreductase [Gaiellaceae bacterium]|nr:FAD-binding oxidoreductase [Gaiellaceae bacterium]
MDIGALRERLAGELLQPEDDGFSDARRVWNVRADRSPDVVVRCRDSGDVAAVVAYARETGTALSVKGGGHSYAMNTVGEGGVLLDLSLMKAIELDRDAGMAVVEPGVVCAELDRATVEHGLATPLPTVSSVGVAGAALGGGSGYLSRKYGLSLDNLVSVDVVTADGKEVRASEEENADLFWAMRGAGANFGVATTLRFRLHEVPREMLAGQIVYPFEDAPEALRFFRHYIADAPHEFQCYPFMFRVPPIEAFPESFHGQPALDFVFCHADSGAAEVVEPLRELGEPILDLVGPLPYPEIQQSFDAALPAGQRYYSKAHYLDELSDAAIDAIAAHVPEMHGEFTAAYLEPLGGAVGAIDRSSTAFAGRDARYSFHILSGWTDPSDDTSVMAWVRSFHDAMQPHANGGVYVNLLGEDESARVPAAYAENYSRLAELKTTWDPDNLFRMNHNIEPVR